MFDRFTDRARRVMKLAQKEARHWRHGRIGTEHILIALTKAGKGRAANVLGNMNVDLKKIQSEIEKGLKSGLATSKTGQLPFTPGGSKALYFAQEEADSFRQVRIGTEHLLLGLMREEKGIAAKALGNIGIWLEDVREEVLESHGIAEAVVKGCLGQCKNCSLDLIECVVNVDLLLADTGHFMVHICPRCRAMYLPLQRD